MMKILPLFILIIMCSCKGEVSEKSNDGVEVKEPSHKQYLTVNFNEYEEYIKNHDADVLVVNFWATWCKPCIKELPAFEKLNTSYKADGVSVILVSLDFPSQLDKLEKFIEKKQLQSEVLFLNDGNENEWIPKVSDRWSGAIPATLVIANNDQEFYERSFTYDELEKTINIKK